MAMAALPGTPPEARVLVVDDETNIVELLSVSLKFQGFEVHTASNGPAALDKAREIRPDAVILDVMMPGMDGVEVCRRMDHTSTKVLMLTALGDVTTEVASLEAGARGFLTKPFSSMDLLDRVEALLTS